MNIRTFARIALPLSALGLAGCPSFINAPGPPFVDTKIPDGKGQLYVYRPAAKIMGDYAIYTFFPDKNCFKLESGGYLQFIADPGPLKFTAVQLATLEKAVEIRAGESKYVEVTIEDDKPVLTEVLPEVAKPKIAQTRGVNACSVEEIAKGGGRGL